MHIKKIYLLNKTDIMQKTKKSNWYKTKKKLFEVNYFNLHILTTWHADN